MEHFRQIPDYRCNRKNKHNLEEMLVCIIVGFLCGRTTIRRSLNWCRNNIKWLRKYMPLKNGIASPATVSRMLSGIDEELFLYTFMEWIGEIVDSKNTQLAVDGKALRGATKKVKSLKTPMIMNVILDISESTVTIDAIGTQAAIMNQIHEQGGHFVLTVKKNQPEACEEIHEFMNRLEEAARKQHNKNTDYTLAEYMDKYEEVSKTEKNRDRYEYRKYKICNDASELTKVQKEWCHVKSLGQICQIRIPIERDSMGNDVTPSKEEFQKNGSRRAPVPAVGSGAGKDIQCVAIISDRHLTAKELGEIKRKHWTIENSLHHVLDDTFREDRCPAKKSRNNLSLIRKYAYNILRLAMSETKELEIITEMMDFFCDNAAMRARYIFRGINSLY